MTTVTNLPQFYTIVWINTGDTVSDKWNMAYRNNLRRGKGMVYSGKWTWQVVDVRPNLSVKPDAVKAWQPLSDKQLVEGIREK